MNEKLLGYLLNADEAEERFEVETALRDQSETQRELEELQRLLEPLASDKVEIEPPPGLWINALARVAEYQCREFPHAPLSTSRGTSAPRSRWRLVDALVAASILMLVGGLGVATVGKAWHHYRTEQCSKNLANFYQGLALYSDVHAGQFPQLKSAEPPLDRVGMLVPMLNDARVLPASFSITCPADGRTAPTSQSVQQLVALYQEEPASFQRTVSQLAGSYAYSLGYWERGVDNERHYQGLQRGMLNLANDPLPLMADKPPFAGEGDCDTAGNSPNHSGQGQNVLFTDGSIRFVAGRKLGGDPDIYRNQNNDCAAGLRRSDFVLGAGWSTPGPGPEN